MYGWVFVSPAGVVVCVMFAVHAMSSCFLVSLSHPARSEVNTIIPFVIGDTRFQMTQPSVRPSVVD